MNTNKQIRAIGQQIKYLRKKKSWLQRDVAKASKVALNIVSDVENGKRQEVTFRVLQRILESLGASLEVKENTK